MIFRSNEKKKNTAHEIEKLEKKPISQRIYNRTEIKFRANKEHNDSFSVKLLKIDEEK